MRTIAVIGLGYVGLPLAIAFGKQHNTIGIDLSEEKINAYLQQHDPAGQISSESFKTSKYFSACTDFTKIKSADFVIIAVPTPVDTACVPNFQPLISASKAVGPHLKKGAIVIYESTVYPGATEEVCVPVLEKFSGMKWQTDFYVGYSPERINPGDQIHTLEKIIKIVSGDNEVTLNQVASLYESIIDAGVHRASTIKVAEAAKVIENTQRDLNIALMNELAILFKSMNIDTSEVLEAAGTKWNFLPFKPGLVGGHCIGVDPYYLTYKAQLLNYHPQVILAGRRINDGMGKFVAEQTLKTMLHCGHSIKGAKINILGLTFKENCSDIRNTKVIDIIKELKEYNVYISVHDPIANPAETYEEYGIELSDWSTLPKADALILAVPHTEYLKLTTSEILEKLTPQGCLIDVKSVCDPKIFQARGITTWRL